MFKHIYHRKEVIKKTVNTLVSSITDRYPPRKYRWGLIFEILKPAMRYLILHLQGSTGSVGAATLTAHTVQIVSQRHHPKQTEKTNDR